MIDAQYLESQYEDVESFIPMKSSGKQKSPEYPKLGEKRTTQGVDRARHQKYEGA